MIYTITFLSDKAQTTPHKDMIVEDGFLLRYDGEWKDNEMWFVLFSFSLPFSSASSGRGIYYYDDGSRYDGGMLCFSFFF